MTKKQHTSIKKYKDYKKTIPEQLELFALPEYYQTHYSNTIELYDQMPKYFHGNLGKHRAKNGFLPILEREFRHRNKELKLKISPAILLQKDGTSKSFYPSQREEIVEDVLRKFVSEGRGEVLDEQIAVKFTLYELYKELKNMNHEYNNNEIKESLEILGSTILEITSPDGETSLKSPMFETIGFTTENNGENRKYFVRFNTLVTNSIMNKTWRLVNYDQCMQYKRVISRWLHKRMSHLFLQATLEQPYRIKLSTIIRDSGMKQYKNIGDSIIQIKRCLQEMQDTGTIDKYDIKKIYSQQRKNKIEDAIFSIYVSDLFVSDIKKGHALIKKNLADLNNNTQQEFIIEKSQTKEQFQNNYFQEQNNKKEKDKKLKQSPAILNKKTELTQFLRSFNLSTRYINSILKTINTEEELLEIEQHIIAGQEFVTKQELKQNKSINPAPIIKKSIKEGWFPQKRYSDSQKLKNSKIEAKKQEDSNLEKTKEGRVISNKLKEYFGSAIFNSWMSSLEIENNNNKNNNILALSVNTQFIKDYILNNYWNGVKKGKDMKGDIIWHKKGIVQLVSEIFPNIKDVKIVVRK